MMQKEMKAVLRVLAVRPAHTTYPPAPTRQRHPGKGSQTFTCCQPATAVGWRGTTYLEIMGMEPTPKQLKSWGSNACLGCKDLGDICDHIARLAYAAGADAELKACCEWLWDQPLPAHYATGLRNTRRPTPTSLKQQALDELQEATQYALNNGTRLYTATIRRALEALPDD